ncbi:MAG: choice-of-anchor J domain-containing protein [Dinghuibacter sp.]|nr:choice-of-anchor J domain-containing protein [Dinghuibacter sp.]
MNKLLKFYIPVAALVSTLLVLNACKKTFDAPPTYTDPNMVANTTIKQLKSMHALGGYEPITTDIVISGVVTVDDKSGNFYKEIYIQDGTSGISVQLDGTNLYTSYPIGRKVFIKCKGLYLSDYGGMIQLGVIDRSVPANPTLAGIPFQQFDSYIVKGSLNNPVVPRAVTRSQLNTNFQDSLLGTLVQLDGYEFSAADTGKTYADTSASKNSINLTIKDCSTNNIIVRTSGFASFAGQHPAGGNGKITALYTIFNSTRQLIVRDLNDIQFTGQRCAMFEDDFNSIGANNGTLNSSVNWQNVSEVGTVKYQNAVFGSVKCAKVSAFSTGNANVTSWLISPAIPLPAGSSPKFSFTSAAGFLVGAVNFRVYVSTNYTGTGAPSAATWTQLPATMATAPASGFSAFVSSGILDLTPYAGQTVYIGYRYDGGDPGRTTTYEIDDVKIVR